MTGKNSNVDLILQVFRAVENRDEEALLQLFDPVVEFQWPESLPYGGVFSGVTHPGLGWGDTWDPLQPTLADRKLDPRVIAASDDEVVVLWKQKGISATGERFEGEVLGLYRFRGGRLARAQMFYFDSAAVAHFLEGARGKVAA